MKNVKTNIVAALVVLLSVVGCAKQHDDRHCQLDSRIYFQLVDKQGNTDLNGLYGVTGPSFDLYDGDASKTVYRPHYHKIDSEQRLEGAYGLFLSPQICDKTFPKVRGIFSVILHRKSDDKRYAFADTIDAELAYMAPDNCLIKSYSLNGVPQWQRDTCQTESSRNIRVCLIVCDSVSFTEKLD